MSDTEIMLHQQREIERLTALLEKQPVAEPVAYKVGTYLTRKLSDAEIERSLFPMFEIEPLYTHPSPDARDAALRLANEVVERFMQYGVVTDRDLISALDAAIDAAMKEGK